MNEPNPVLTQAHKKVRNNNSYSYHKIIFKLNQYAGITVTVFVEGPFLINQNGTVMNVRWSQFFQTKVKLCKKFLKGARGTAESFPRITKSTWSAMRMQAYAYDKRASA